MTARRLLRLAAPAVCLAALASACGGAAAEVDPCDGLQIKLPPTLGGLSVKANPKAAATLLAEAGKQTYARDASVFALRDGKELRAIFEVVRLSPDARPEEVDFRKKIVAGVGGTSRKPEKISDTLVYKARQNQQIFNIWFQDCFLEVLIVREDETVKGRAVGVDVGRLLSEALALKPVSAG